MTDTKPSRSTLSNRRKRAALKAQGLVRRDVWIYREDWPAVKEYAEKLTERRESLADAKARRK